MFDNLRQEAKITKALDGVSFKEMAEAIEVKQTSFYAFIKGQYDLSVEKAILLKEFLALARGE